MRRQQINFRYYQTKKVQLLQELKGDNSEIKEYSDISSGWQYLQAVIDGKINETSIVFMFGMDGTQLYWYKKSDCWFNIFVLLEFVSEAHYQKKHVILGGIFPGSNKPTLSDSFLYPSFYHIAALQYEGLRIWDASSNGFFVADLYYLLNCSDISDSVYLSRLVGYHGVLSCHLFCGFEGQNKPGSLHYYPALLLPNNYTLDKTGLPDKNPDIIGFSSEDYYMT